MRLVSGLLTFVLSLSLLGAGLFFRQLAATPIHEYPLADYCDVGVCLTESPNQLLTAKVRKEDPAELVDLGRTLCAQNPNNAYAWADLAEVTAKQGDQQLADKEFQMALQLAPANPAIRSRFQAFSRRSL